MRGKIVLTALLCLATDRRPSSGAHTLCHQRHRLHHLP